MGQEEADMSKTINLAYTTAPIFCSVEKKKAGKKPKLQPAMGEGASGASYLVY